MASKEFRNQGPAKLHPFIDLQTIIRKTAAYEAGDYGITSFPDAIKAIHLGPSEVKQLSCIALDVERSTMTNAEKPLWAPRRMREEALEKIEAGLADEPNNVEFRFDRARLLTELGRGDEAKQAYLELLKRAPTHRGALNNLGSLLQSTGYRAAARTCYVTAIAHHPDYVTAHINLGDVYMEDKELDLAKKHYEKALSLEPEHSKAHQGLARVFRELGDDKRADQHRQAGFEKQAVTVLPYRGNAEPIPVLLLVSGSAGNIPFRALLDNNLFLVIVVVMEFYDLTQPLPPYRLIVNLVGDADLCRPALEAALRLIEKSSVPVINHPHKVLATGRIENARRLGQLPDVKTASIVDVSRDDLERQDALMSLAGRGISIPFLLRSPGFHNGRHFAHVGQPEDLESVLSALPGEHLLALEYLDARSADGKIRKYRAMMIGGKIYPLHAAVSNQWKIHFVTADMAEVQEHRREDEAFLADMDAVLGPRAMEALRQINQTLGLDYAGIDFSLDAAGRILLFEANATMFVPPPDSDPKWEYRRAPIERIANAVRHMLATKTTAS